MGSGSGDTAPHHASSHTLMRASAVGSLKPERDIAMEEQLLALVDRELDSRAARNAAMGGASTVERVRGYSGNVLPIIGAVDLQPADRTVLRTNIHGFSDRFDSEPFPTQSAPSVRGFSVDPLPGGRIGQDELRAGPSGYSEPTVGKPGGAGVGGPESQFRNLVSEWVPSKRYTPYQKNRLKSLFETARGAIEKKCGVGFGGQHYYEDIYNEFWNREVKTLLSRRAKVLIYGERTGNDYRHLLEMNRQHLIEYFHGDVQRTDALLSWWQTQ